jgi:X-Pro dipeptidyl-peptidase
MRLASDARHAARQRLAAERRGIQLPRSCNELLRDTMSISRSPSMLVATVLIAAPLGVSAQGTVGPVFRDGQAQVVPAFEDPSDWIRHELWVETEFDTDGDGELDRMHVAVVRPGQTEDGLQVPVIYESSPYFAGTSGPRDFLWDVRQELGDPSPPRTSQPDVITRLRAGISDSQVADWVPRGFAVVHSEAPGTGLSQGCPTIGGPPEALAPKAVIDWLNGRATGYSAATGSAEVEAPWSTGKVGMTGTSYNGTIPVAAATTGVDGLEAIIPIAPNTSYYRYYRSNGLVRHPGGWLGEDIDFLYDFVNSGDPAKRAYCNRTIRDGEMLAKDRMTGDYNDFWAARDFQNDLDGIKAATLMAHAFNDWNVVPDHSVIVYEYLKAQGVPVQAYYHQGGHGGAPPMELMNRWFTRYLYDVENGVEDDPRAWIVREGDDRLEPTPYADYPNPEAVPVRLHPTMGGTGGGGLSTTGADARGIEGLVDNVSFSGEALAQAEWTNHRLMYTTSELAQNVHISGTPRVTVRVSSSKPAANLSVWLVSLPWTGGRNPRGGLITRGWADPQNHSSLTDGEPLVPGEFYDVTFNLQPDDQIVPAGQKIGLMIFSSDRDFTLWPEPGTELSIDLSGTSIDLPVVGGVRALGRIVS